MAVKPNVTPPDKEATFVGEELYARALRTEKETLDAINEGRF